MAIVTTSDCLTYIGESTSVEPTVDGMRQAVEAYISNICHRTFESTSYVELCDGTGGKWLYLRNYPVTALTQVAIDFDGVIRLTCTATDAHNAYFTVDSSGVTFTIQGGSSAGSTTLDFATYTTVSSLNTAINALSDWESTIPNSSYNDLMTSKILEAMNVYCGNYASTTGTYGYLYIGEPLYGIDIDTDNGTLYYSGAFPAGWRNVYVAYTAGYSSSNMPWTLKEAVFIGVKALWDKYRENAFGLSSMSLGDVTTRYITSIPPEVRTLLYEGGLVKVNI